MDYEEYQMVKAAWYYYMEAMTQNQIAELMGISRMRVIRLLSQARQQGVISFQMKKGSESRMQMEQQLMERYHLKDIFIMPAAVNPADCNERVAEAASMYIHDHLQPGGVISIGYGDTPSRVLNKLASMTEEPLTFLSLTGGVSYYLPDTHSNVFNARLHLIPTPLLVGSPELAVALRQETAVQDILRMIQVSHMTVVGIGSLDGDATIFRNNILSGNDLLYLKMQGAVADVLCHFMDRDGRLLKTPMEDRLISTSLETMQELRNVIGVAAGDRKVDAIRAVLRGGLLDVLVTDDRTAAQLLNTDEAT